MKKGLSFFTFLRGTAIVLGSFLLVVSVVFAATTIGTNITTGGTLDVSGNSTFGNAATDVNLFTGTLQASTTAMFTGNSIFYGQLLASSTAVFDGNTTLAAASTTGTLYVASYASSTGGLFTQGNFHAGGTGSIDGATTFRGTMNLSKAAGGTFDLTTSTATTTPGIFSRDHKNSTSTVSIGDVGATASTVGCLEVAGIDNVYYNCFVDAHAGGTTTGFFLVCHAGRCR